MYKLFVCACFLLAIQLCAMAQNIGIGTINPDASAQLDITASDKGLLVPRISITNIASAAPVTSPATGLLVYNTNASIVGGSGVGFYFWNGSQWTKLSTGGASAGAGWQLTGNAGTNAATDFIGTTDNNALVFKQNNQLAGLLNANNTAWGANSFASNTSGAVNTAIGNYALNANSTGSYNTATGNGAMFSNTSGPYNTAIGANALGFNSTAKANVAVGYNAMFFNAGDSNVAVGVQALENSGTGYGNTAIGNLSLKANLSGIHNTAVGLSAMKNNGNGSNNVAVGHWALLKNVSGSFNTAIGERSLENNNLGAHNTASGWYTLFANTSGGYNAAFGDAALASNTTGVYNTAIGSNALPLNTTADYNTAVGGNTLSFNTIGEKNAASGYGALNKNSVGNFNTATGYGALQENTVGNKNTALGHFALVNSTNTSRNIAVGYNAATTNTGSNNIVIGAETNVAIPSADNQIQMGNGDVTYAAIKVAWTITSDSRYKTNIKTSPLGLAFINQLKPVAYTRTNDAAQKTEYGFIAQEVEQTLMAFGDANNGIISKDYQGMYGMRYNDLMSPLVKAVQEQQAIIDAQSKKITALETALLAKNAQLETELKAIKKRLGIQ